MAKTPKTDAQYAAWFSDPGSQLGVLSEMTGKNFEIAQTAGQAMLQGALGMGQELSNFISGRMKKDVEAVKAISGCRSLSDVCRAQADFLGEAARDYADQTSRMLNMGANAAAETVDAVASMEPVSELGMTGAAPEPDAPAEKPASPRKAAADAAV